MTKILRVIPIRDVYLDNVVLGELLDKGTMKHKYSKKVIDLAYSKAIKLKISGFTYEEIDKAPDDVRRRLHEIVGNIPVKVLPFKSTTDKLGSELFKKVKELNEYDAYHLATAAIHSINVFLSWNRASIVNEKIIKKINKIINFHGYKIPLILAPDDFFERMSTTSNGRILIEID